MVKAAAGSKTSSNKKYLRTAAGSEEPHEMGYNGITTGNDRCKHMPPGKDKYP